MKRSLVVKLAAIVVIIIAIGAYLYVSDAIVEDEQTLKNPVAEWSWQARQTGLGESKEPLMELSLFSSPEKVLLYQTNCTGLPSSTMSDAAEALSAIQCWWAGGGDQFGVFAESSTRVVKHRTVDEEAGFGAWEVVKTLE